MIIKNKNNFYAIIRLEGIVMNETENIRAITNFLFIADDIASLKPTDLVIILCNSNIDGIVALFDDLFKRQVINNQSTVVISGSHGPLDDFKEKECQLVYQKLVQDYGYDKKLFILEDNATNIYENLFCSRQIIKDFSNYNHILIMGAHFALRRIKLCASGLDYPLTKIKFVGTIDTEKRKCNKDDWWKSELARTRVYQELERIGKYLVKGDLDIK